MKKIIPIVILALIFLLMLIFSIKRLAQDATQEADRLRSIYNSRLGTYIEINREEKQILDYSIYEKCFYLSDGQKINANLVFKDTIK